MLNTNAISDHEKINVLLIRTLCIFWLPAKLIGWRMSTTYRLFPTAPVFENFDRVPPIIHLVLFILSLVLILLIFIFYKNKSLLWGLLAVEIFSCMLDQNRLNPWEYQNLFIIFIFIVNAGNQRLVTVAFAFILTSTYFYSGFGKLNEGFLNTVWTKLLLEAFFKIPPAIALQHWMHLGGYLVGLTELIAGVGLMFLKTRKISAVVLIVMHLFILLFLGPFGLWYNKIVWPWNLAMIFYLYFIYLKKDQIIIPLKSIFIGWNRLVFIFWGILPALNFIGWWDNYLSSSIYSGKTPRMIICIKDTAKCKPLQRFCRAGHHFCKGGAFIELQYWAMSETNVLPYPEIRVYKELQVKLERQYADAGLSCVFVEGGK